jgi:hypothetical protein
MKRYIKCTYTINPDAIDTSLFSGTPFKCDTDASYYNDFLNTKELKYMQEQKNRTGEIVMMSPNEYISECADHIFNGRVSVQELKDQRYASHTESGESLIAKYADDMRSGDKFPLCYLNYVNGGQEGLHRMMAAGEAFGWDTKFPVLVVTVFSQQKEDFDNLVSDYWDFLEDHFNNICDIALDPLISYDAPPPNNFAQLFRESIISTAATYEDGYDIDVDIEMIPMDNGDFKVDTRVSKFGEYTPPVLSSPYTFNLSSYFDLGIEKEESTNTDTLTDEDIDRLLDEVDIDDIDLSDAGIAKLFSKYSKR